MTFVEAAIEILKHEGRPLHVKKLTELAIARNLLSLVGKDPEGQMQARLLAELKKTTGETPLTRGAAAGTFGLKIYPPRAARSAEPKETPVAKEKERDRDREKDKKEADAPAKKKKPAGKAAAAADKPAKKPARAKAAAAPKGRGKAKAAAAEAEVAAPVEAPEPEMIELDLGDAPAPAAPAAAAPVAQLPLTGVPAGSEGERTGRRRRRRRGGRGRGGEAGLPGAPGSPGGAPFDADQGDADGGLDVDVDAERDDAGAPEGPGGEPRPPSRPPVTMSFDAALERVRPPGSAPLPPAYVTVPRPSLPPEPSAPSSYAGAQAAQVAAVAEAAMSAPPAGSREDDGGPDDADADAGSDGPPSHEQQPQPGDAPRRQPEVVHVNRPDPGGFRSVPLADAAYEVLRTQGDGRPVHYRQIADMAVKRRLVRPDAPDVWRALRAAMLQESRDRQGQGLRPRIRHHGNGLFALATRRLEPELMTAEKELTGKHAELRALTRIALRRRLGRLPPTAFEHLVRVLLERVGYTELANIKRGEGVTYYGAVLARGALPVRVLIGIRAGEGDLGRKAVGELRVGVRLKQFEEGLLIGVGRLGPDGLAEARQGLAVGGAAMSVIDGDALADLLIRHGVGVLKVQLPVEYLDPELFADLSEG